MTQTSITGQHQALVPVRARLSEVLHAAAVDVFGLPPDWAIRGWLAHEMALPYEVGR